LKSLRVKQKRTIGEKVIMKERCSIVGLKMVGGEAMIQGICTAFRNWKRQRK
jgi:hypothetical protein